MDEDAHAFANFIVEFLSRHGRWNSPKYLFGESYGTTRASVLAYVLENEKSLDLNSVILLSAFLCADDSVDAPQYNPGVDQPYVLALPTYAATAWYHHKLPGPAFPQSLEPFLAEVEQLQRWVITGEPSWRVTHCPRSASPPSPRNCVITRDCPHDRIEQAGLRVNGGEFEDPARRRGHRRPPGQPFRRAHPRSYEQGGGVRSAVRGDLLGVRLRIQRLRAQNVEVRRAQDLQGERIDIERQWDFLHQPAGATTKVPQSMNVMPDLAAAMKQNPDLKVQLNGGYFDLATPFFAAFWGATAAADTAVSTGQHRNAFLHVRPHGLRPRAGLENPTTTQRRSSAKRTKTKTTTQGSFRSNRRHHHHHRRHYHRPRRRCCYRLRATVVHAEVITSMLTLSSGGGT